MFFNITEPQLPQSEKEYSSICIPELLQSQHITVLNKYYVSNPFSAQLETKNKNSKISHFLYKVMCDKNQETT